MIVIKVVLNKLDPIKLYDKLKMSPTDTKSPMYLYISDYRAGGPICSPSMSKQWNLKSAVEIHMIDTHFEVGEW